jgi:hypothetical protein
VSELDGLRIISLTWGIMLVERNSTVDAIPRHVFMSFATPDLDIARSIGDRLNREGVTTWIAPTELAPASLDWEAAVREAIAASFAVVLLASPDSVESRYVRGELGVADARGIPIMPVWVRGDKWAQCVPLVLQHAQYIDIRGDRYERGVIGLAAHLRDHIATTLPDRFKMEPSTRDEGGRPIVVRPRPPRGFVAIHLRESDTDESALMARVSAYACNGDLLDDLFLNSLARRHGPFTYGKEWVLISDGRWLTFNRMFVPFEWLEKMEGVWESGLTSWLRRPLAIEQGSRWRISTIPLAPWGIAVADERILDAFGHPKKAYALRMSHILSPVPYKDVPLQQLPHRAVLGDWMGFGEAPGRGEVLIQTAEIVDDYLLR